MFICVLSILFIGAEAHYDYNGYCKEPQILRSLMDDDVRAAAPFYVVAMTKSPATEKIDNVCYTYFDQPKHFRHIISIVFKNGSSVETVLYKMDLEGHVGVGIAAGEDCSYLDVTMLPACNETVFPLYRCFLTGACANLDMGPLLGVDARVMITANPRLSEDCKKELIHSKSDPALDVGDQGVVLLPWKRPFQCATTYNNQRSINYDKEL